MRNYTYDHVHLRSPDPDATARFFETMFDAEVMRSTYPPGTLYPGQMRVTMKVGGQKVLIAPTHPHDPTADAPRFPYYGLEHIGLTVDDVDAACDELRAQGADVAIGPLNSRSRYAARVHPRAGRHHGRAGAEPLAGWPQARSGHVSSSWAPGSAASTQHVRSRAVNPCPTRPRRSAAPP